VTTVPSMPPVPPAEAVRSVPSAHAVLPPELSDFPFPLDKDAYRYSANLQPGGRRQVTETGSWGEAITRVGPDYEEFIAERARILAADPGRLISVPYLQAAEWDTLLYLMRHLAAEYPADFGLTESTGPGGRARWVNRRLHISQDFTPGDPATLPSGPLEFIGRQVVEDLVLLDEREDHLWADAGLVTFASGWSFPFVAGMSFREIHGPVPRANPDGVFARAEAFLMRLQPGEVYRRLNWTFQPGRMLDRSMDACTTWMPEVAHMLAALSSAGPDDAELARNVYLRVELQHLVRLETSGAVLFLIDTRFLSLADLASVPEWATRAIAVLAELPQDMADYKGLTGLRPGIIECLRRRTAARPPC
jgi:dimethylamine monooxygenase subunit A